MQEITHTDTMGSSSRLSAGIQNRPLERTMQQVKPIANNYHCLDHLRDGRTIAIRSIHPEDKEFLQEEMKHLSAQSRYYRFLTPKKQLSDEELIYFSEVDFIHHVALLACLLVDGEEVPVGTGRFVASAASAPFPGAELAFEVEDEFQGLGVATILLKHLAKIARQLGIDEFVALVLSENRKMLEVFRNSGFPMKAEFALDGTCEVRLSLNVDDEPCSQSDAEHG
jgi:Acetyltransferases, including N-acetylases of ribosomal proteins